MASQVQQIQHTGARQVRPILAINPDGTVTKANLQAKRTFEDQDVLEGKDIGSLLADVLSKRKTPSLILSLANNTTLDQVLLVLSDGHAAGRGESRLANPAEPVPEVDPTAGEAIGDYIAHELRNDIAIILGLAQLMANSFESINRSDRLAAFRGIQAEAEHAQLVLDGLLRLAERHSKPEPARTCVPVHAILEHSVGSHCRRHPGRRFLLSGDWPVFALANSTWLEIAFLNLLSNAEKVTPADQPIEVAISHEGSHCMILVLDRGQTLAPEVYSALWRIRSKGPPAGVEVTGSGIGLSLCKALVEAMGGRVWAGPRPGGGSVFTLNLPLAPLPAELPFLAA